MGNVGIIGDRIVERVLQRLWERGYLKDYLPTEPSAAPVVRELKRMVADELDNIVLY